MPVQNNKNRKPKWNIGYTTKKHLCIDLDNTCLCKATKIAQLLIDEHPEIGDCLIVESSKSGYAQVLCHMPETLPYIKVKRDCYHLIFDNFIPYEKSCKIIETLAYLGVLAEAFIRIRDMRNDMTLRVSSTINMDYTKPPPKIAGYVANKKCMRKGEGISLYLSLLRCFMNQ